jgi:hypothetical protein
MQTSLARWVLLWGFYFGIAAACPDQCCLPAGCYCMPACLACSLAWAITLHSWWLPACLPA